MVSFHIPVLLKEALEFLRIKPGAKYIDATVGGGGHAEAILKAGGKVLGLDCDPEAIKFVQKHLVSACPLDVFDWKIVQGNFASLKKVARENGFEQPDGILFDLGVSSFQLKTPKRGFSFKAGLFLDMRMDPELKVTAADLVNGLTKGELYELFSKYGEEKLAWPVAAAIVRARRLGPITKSEQIAVIVSRIYHQHYRTKSKIHPATKVFQALRIAVNDELNNLKKALPQAIDLLSKNGRLVVISFHGLEDRAIKVFFRNKKKENALRILTIKPIAPSIAEIRRNPRARSAKLRAAEKE